MDGIPVGDLVVEDGVGYTRVPVDLYRLFSTAETPDAWAEFDGGVHRTLDELGLEFTSFHFLTGFYGEGPTVDEETQTVVVVIKPVWYARGLWEAWVEREDQ